MMRAIVGLAALIHVLVLLPSCDRQKTVPPPNPSVLNVSSEVPSAYALPVARAEPDASGTAENRQDRPAARPSPVPPLENPTPSVRAYPTGEVPDDPYLAVGHRVYRDACMVCHDRGTTNAPPVTDVIHWTTRIAKGREVLHRHAINGYTGDRGFMPPKGGSPGSWSDAEVRAAVDYIIYLVERQRSRSGPWIAR